MTAEEREIEGYAKVLWDADYHGAMADDRDWEQVDGWMRDQYLRRAAALVASTHHHGVKAAAWEAGFGDCRKLTGRAAAGGAP